MTSSHTLTFTDDNFTTEVLEADRPVLVDFWAAWCGPCRAIGPIIDQLAVRYAGRVKVGKVDVDVNQSTAAAYGVQSIPTLLVFSRGTLVERVVGLMPRDQLIRLLDAQLLAPPAVGAGL